MRKQLRAFHTPEKLAEIYRAGYDHTKWEGHRERIKKTTAELDRFAAEVGACTVADLSCGDGAVVNNSIRSWSRITLGDFATTGPIEEAIKQTSPTDMFVLSETLEHIADPDSLLLEIRKVAKHLLLTTPVNDQDVENEEHYWSWDVEGVGSMLRDSGWHAASVELFTPASDDWYTYQIWRCS